MVEIAKALVRQPRLIIMDEATSALAAREVEQLYRIIRQLRNRGLAVLYISHRMHEIAALADVCSVFRNGKHIDTFPMTSRTTAQIVPMMIGRDVTRAYPPKPGANGATANHGSSKMIEVAKGSSVPALEVKGLHWERVLNGISLTVGKGEIVGLGGLDGQGQTELLLALFGVLRRVAGEVRTNGVRPRSITPGKQKRPRLEWL